LIFAGDKGKTKDGLIVDKCFVPRSWHCGTGCYNRLVICFLTFEEIQNEYYIAKG
jgi:hypothetical protein